MNVPMDINKNNQLFLDEYSYRTLHCYPSVRAEPLPGGGRADRPTLHTRPEGTLVQARGPFRSR